MPFGFCFQLFLLSLFKIVPNLERGAPPSVSFRLKKNSRNIRKGKNDQSGLLYDKNAKQKTVIFHKMLLWFQMPHRI